MRVLVTCYYDYICPYSYRAFHWLSRLRRTEGIEVRWATFSLKEASHAPTDPSPFEDQTIPSSSVLALALAHAIPEEGFPHYHERVFEAMHGNGRRLGASDLLALAADAGLDTDAFDRERPRWLGAVAEGHRDAVTRLGVFGTPTLTVDDEAAVFLKFTELPEPARDANLWKSVYSLARCHPELVEIKRTS